MAKNNKMLFGFIFALIFCMWASYGFISKELSKDDLIFAFFNSVFMATLAVWVKNKSDHNLVYKEFRKDILPEAVSEYLASKNFEVKQVYGHLIIFMPSNIIKRLWYLGMHTVEARFYAGKVVLRGHKDFLNELNLNNA